MSTLYYDLHIHSCLSPCGDEDMTPGNICGMARLCGLGIVALTDHNTARNTRVFCERAAEMGLIGIPGMELTTREEAHVVCLFPDPGRAERFSAYVEGRLPGKANLPEIFGPQILIGDNDEPCGESPFLLTNAADIGIYDTAALVGRYGGFCFPAHIDRESLSLLSSLGMWDDGMGFGLCEYSRPPEGTHPIDAAYKGNLPSAARPLGAAAPIPYLADSDAHRLADIMDGRFQLSVPEPTAAAVLDTLRRLAAGGFPGHS